MTLTEPLARAMKRAAEYHAEWQPRMRDEVDQKWLSDHETALVLAALRSDPEVIERIAEALHTTKSCTDKCDHEYVEWTWSSVDAFATAIANVLFGEVPR